MQIYVELPSYEGRKIKIEGVSEEDNNNISHISFTINGEPTTLNLQELKRVLDIFPSYPPDRRHPIILPKI